MASGFHLAPGETVVRCPYQFSHIITTARLITHLDKCRNNYVREMKEKGKPVELVACRFNYTHKIPLPEKKFHEDNCSDSNTIIPALYSEPVIKPVTEVNRCTAPLPEEEDAGENWDVACDDTVNQAGYDPKQKLEKECFLYQPRGLTKSQRKAYRVENRKKWNEAANTAPTNLPTNRQEPPTRSNGSSGSASAVVADVNHELAAAGRMANNSRAATTSAASAPAISESYDWEEE